jgi:GTP-binding protein YchF
MNCLSVSCGIVGLPNAGKSTLFKALTSIPVLIKDYPFTTIEPNVGLVPIVDERLDSLALISKPEKITPAYLKIVDVAGLVEGASRGEGLGNQFLGNLREVDLLIHTLADYEKGLQGSASGEELVEKAETVNQELILSDLAAIERRISKTEKKTRGGEDAAEELASLKRAHVHLNNGQPLVMMEMSGHEVDFLQESNLLTGKRSIYVLNRNEENVHDEIPLEIKEYAERQKASLAVVCAKLEAELQELEPGERELFLTEYKLGKTALNNIVDICRKALGLITFFTIKGVETRAWLINDGTRVGVAAGKVHSDMQKGFISAEAISFDKLVECGSLAAAREKGLIRTEGKNYVVHDADVLLFRFSSS